MEEDESRETHNDEDPFTRMMFGSGNPGNRNTENDLLQPSGLDFEELMVNIDALVESAKNLKPLFQKVFPVIEKLWKKE
jgi:hypothetical protein